MMIAASPSEIEVLLLPHIEFFPYRVPYFAPHISIPFRPQLLVVRWVVKIGYVPRGTCTLLFRLITTPFYVQEYIAHFSRIIKL